MNGSIIRTQIQEKSNHNKNSKNNYTDNKTHSVFSFFVSTIFDLIFVDFRIRLFIIYCFDLFYFHLYPIILSVFVSLDFR